VNQGQSPAVDSDLRRDVDDRGQTTAARAEQAGPGEHRQAGPPASLTSIVRTVSCSSSVTSTGVLPSVRALELDSATMRPASSARQPSSGYSILVITE
jgi:hypothetical protein